MNRSCRPRWILLAPATTLLALALAAGTARAGEPPDATTLLRLKQRISVTAWVRVEVPIGRMTCNGVKAGNDGVSYGDWFRPGVPRSELPKSPIPWSQVSGIEVAHTAVGRGAALGALAGLVAGFVWNAADPPRSQGGFLKFAPTAEGITIGRILLATAGGTAVGAGVGNTFRRWEHVYP